LGKNQYINKFFHGVVNMSHVTVFLQDVFTFTTNTTRVHVNCMEAGSNVFCSLDLATYKYWL